MEWNPERIWDISFIYLIKILVTNQIIMWRFLGTRVTRRSFSTAGWWDHVGPAPKDPITGVTEAFLADRSPHKINLGVGAYRDDEGKPVLLQCVQAAEAKIAGSKFLESISTATNTKMVEESVKLMYGEGSDVIIQGRFAGVAALSGTGACRLFAEFQRRFRPQSHIYLPDPTWSNHHNIWRDAQVPVKTFRYYNPDTRGLNFSSLMDDIKVNRHFPFFDMAYQGFASGDLERDTQAIQIFLEDGHLIGCAQSFAKNMGLYGHRVGCLSVLCNDAKQAAPIKSQLQQIARAMYSSPPIHGVLLVSTILSDPDLKALWVREVKVMANRIHRMRATLRESLEKLSSPLNWEHITNQVGMFCFSGLTPDQIDQLVKDFHIYMTRDGRMSMAGVTARNVNYLANAIHEVTRFRKSS